MAGKKVRKQAVAMLNDDLHRLRKWSRKAERGSDKSKHLAARERWLRLCESGCKTSCCGKPEGKLCKRCPRRSGEVIALVGHGAA